MTAAELAATAGIAAEAIRALNHQTRPGAAQIDAGLDVTDVYDLLADLALMAGRLPQLLGQLEALVDDLVDAGDITIADGDYIGDPVAVAAVTGHWLAASADAASELAQRVDQAQQTLTWAARAER